MPAHFRLTFILALLLTPCLLADDAGSVKFKDISSAAGSGTVDDVRYFLDRGADVNAKDNIGMTVLHHAVSYNNDPDVIKFLIENGADIHAKAYDDKMPIHLAACANPSILILKTLLEHGADVNAKDKNGRTPIELAAHADLNNPSVDTLKFLIEQGADVDALVSAKPWTYINENRQLLIKSLAEPDKYVHAVDVFGDTPLHIAVRSEYHLDVLKFLIEHGADVNAQNKKGLTPIHCAAAGKARDTVAETLEILIEHGADIRAKDNDGKKAIHHAAIGGNSNALDFLRDKLGDDGNARDEYGNTQIYLAAFHYNAGAVKFLIEQGADVNAKNDRGNTPLHGAVSPNATSTDPSFNVDVVKLLLEHGADIHAKNNDGMMPIHFAAKRTDHINILKTLIEHGTDVNAKTDAGQTPLDLARNENIHINENVRETIIQAGGREAVPFLDIFAAARKGTVKDIEFFIEQGFDIHTDNYGKQELLRLAVTNNPHLEVMKFLIDQGADVNAKDGYGNPLLLTAIWYNYRRIDVVKFLVGQGADVRAVGSDRSPIHAATYPYGDESREYGVLNFLLEQGANVNEKGKSDGFTPLHCVVNYDAGSLRLEARLDIMKILIHHDAIIDAKDNNGMTPLHLAAKLSRDSEILKLLIEHGADVNAKDNDGKTPMDFARSEEMKAIFRTGISHAAPESVGLDPAVLALIDAEVQKSLAEKSMPGCVVCIGRHGKIAYLKAFGNKQVVPEVREMTTDTVFDMASITKPMATAVSVMILVDRGEIDVDANVSAYLPEFDTPEKRGITVRQLLLHTAGFIPDNHLNDYRDGTAKSVERLLALKPQTPPGTRFTYSDVSFQLLGILVERVSGKGLGEFARENIYEPLGMTETMFCPDDELSLRAAPTQDRALGKVHDPRAFLTDGVAGHAGLFSTAEDVAVYATMMLNSGQYKDLRILKPETVQLMTERNRVPGGYRGLGWDMRTGYSGNRGQTMSPRAFGHGGFTGTSLWIDPATDLFVIFLSNRVHPDGNGNVNPLCGRIGTIAADAVTDEPDVKKKLTVIPAKPTDEVLPGLDVLREDDFSLLHGKRVGLITNHTGRTRDGTFITKTLTDHGIRLTALFSPEHGFTGEADTDGIPNSIDAPTGLPIFSLYGDTRRPTPEMLDAVDILVFDIQDIGSRFYTYTSTMALGMEAAADKGIPFVVLDRPNPIRGDRVEGPMLQAGREAFIAHHRMPVRHGMTMGELAVMIAAERRFDAELIVVPCAGWTRSMDYAATKLPWVNPSPNMKTLAGAYFYTGLGLLEYTNLAVGRGTDIPFEQFGAPWIMDAESLADALTEAARNAKLEGVCFEPTQFTPPYREFQNEPCAGIRMVLEDPEKLRAMRMGMVIAATLRRLYPDAWQTARLNTLLLRDRTREMILDGRSAAEIEAEWVPELERFLRRRERYLLYQ